jgi:hypothetical protein
VIFDFAGTSGKALQALRKCDSMLWRDVHGGVEQVY